MMTLPPRSASLPGSNGGLQEVNGIDRLHVVMTVEQHVRRAGLGRVANRPDGRPCRAAPPRSPAPQIAPQPFGSTAAIAFA